ncbi:unnamed protein product [Lathyrus oleraceus]
MKTPLPRNVHFPILYNLTQMEFDFNFNFNDKWRWILKMLQQSPNLQHLIIHEEIENENGINDNNWEDPSFVPECLSSRLRTCLLRCSRGTECEVKFVEYVMKNSKVLSIMTIHNSSSISLNTKDEILHICPKACKLIFD